MRRFGTANAPVSAFLTVLLPVGLWTMLWLSIQSGAPGSISWGSPSAVILGLRVWFPMIAAGTAIVIVVVKFTNGAPRGFGVFGPLGLATIYGMVALIATRPTTKNTLVSVSTIERWMKARNDSLIMRTPRLVRRLYRPCFSLVQSAPALFAARLAVLPVSSLCDQHTSVRQEDQHPI